MAFRKEKCMFLISVICLMLGEKGTALQCYQGFVSSGMMETKRNASLLECPADSKCCVIFTSFPGTRYSCYNSCPEKGADQCGPAAETRLMDVGWCYCEKADDPKCMPYYLQQQ